MRDSKIKKRCTINPNVQCTIIDDAINSLPETETRYILRKQIQ